MPILALDAGTTSTRAMLFGDEGAVLASAQHPVTQHYPRDGWVEHDATEIWETTRRCAREAIAAAGVEPARIAAIGIAVQRETVVVWDRESGHPIHRAIVWQDRRTADECARIAREPGAAELVARTGLLLDPYFSATKLAWILDHVAGARDAAASGALLAGTVDSWLLWCLTGGAVHATDSTNASRTLLFDIHRLAWDDALCALFRVPRTLLPEVRDSAADFGTAQPSHLGAAIPIRALVGDQQGAAVGQDCLRAGQGKATYGTGCFVLVHTGDAPRVSKHRLLTTVALQLDGHATYALEGSIFNAGSVVQWLRDAMGLVATATETAELAASVATSGGVYLVPAFTGLGAPWWDPDARGLIAGITRDTGRAQVVRAALEAVALQTRDLADAYRDDGVPLTELRVDGGMAANDWLLQAIADQLRVPVHRPAVLETTAWGAARLAGAHLGVYPALGTPGAHRVERTIAPSSDLRAAEALHAGWLDAVRRARSVSPR